MRKKIVGWLMRLIKILESADKRIHRVRELILLADQLKSSDGSKVDGQRKRSWVLNNLIAEFPDSKIRDLSFLLEHAIQGG